MKFLRNFTLKKKKNYNYEVIFKSVFRTVNNILPGTQFNLKKNKQKTAFVAMFIK